MRKVAFVRLTPEQRTELTERLEREPLNGRQRRHFQILLAADEGGTDEQGAAATGASRSTVERTRRRFAAEGLEAALTDKPRSGAPAESDPIPPAVREATVTATHVCPRCGAGRMVVITEFPPSAPPAGIAVDLEPSLILDSS